MTLTEHLTSVADAIREKTGETAAIAASEFAERILAIETGSSEESGMIARKMTASFPSGTASRSVSVTFSELSSIKFAVAFGVAEITYTGASTLISGYELGTSDDAGISISGNKVTFTSDPPTSTSASITVVAVGEPA